MDRAIRTIAVAGGGPVGLSAALAFARSLPMAKVTVIESTADPAALADRMPGASPTIARIHALIGIDELDLVRDGIASHHVGTVVELSGGETWFQAFAPHGKPVGAVQFDQIWTRANEAGVARPYGSYSAGAVLARAGKFVHPQRDNGSPLSTFQYGLKLESELYRARLREHASAAGIQFSAGQIDRVQKIDGRVSAVSLHGGQRVKADVFIDCTGPAGRLISEIDESFEAWPEGAHAMAIEELEPAGLTPTARMVLTDSGWNAEWPLRKRTIRITSPSAANGAIAIRPGRRTRPWAGNVLAIGDSATAVEPLYGLNLDLAHRAILLALELLPGRDFHPLETHEYNRRSALMTGQVRDFIAMHHANGAAGLPSSLERRLDQYRYRGRLPFQEDEILSRDDWSAALLGLGIVPDNVDPAAAGVSLDRAANAMERIAVNLESMVERLPGYEDYVARMTG